MEQYINKAAIVAKIEDWRDKISKGISDVSLHGHQKADATFEYEILGLVRDWIDTLEVEEVNVESMADKYYDALIDAEFNANIAKHCRLAYYMGARDMLNKIK